MHIGFIDPKLLLILDQMQIVEMGYKDGDFIIQQENLILFQILLMQE